MKTIEITKDEFNKMIERGYFLPNEVETCYKIKETKEAIFIGYEEDEEME